MQMLWNLDLQLVEAVFSIVIFLVNRSSSKNTNQTYGHL